LAISQKEAEMILEPYMPKITKTIKQAVSEFKSDPRQLFYCNRTKACMVSDLINKYVQIELSGIDGVRFSKKYGCNYVIIKDQLTIKFKKMDKNLQTSNIPTQQVERFVCQRSLWTDNEMPPPVTNIFAGYTWDSLHNDCTGIFITCPQGKTNKWYLELGLGNVAEVLPFRSSDDAEPKPRRARARKADHNDKVKNGGK